MKLPRLNQTGTRSPLASQPSEMERNRETGGAIPPCLVINSPPVTLPVYGAGSPLMAPTLHKPKSFNISEKEFTSQVLETAGYLRWKHYYSWSSLHSPMGFPDLCLVRENTDGTASLCFLELKSEKGKLTSAQAEWLDILNKVPGVWARCFKPSDWENIVLLLRRRE